MKNMKTLILNLRKKKSSKNCLQLKKRKKIIVLTLTIKKRKMKLNLNMNLRLSSLYIVREFMDLQMLKTFMVLLAERVK